MDYKTFKNELENYYSYKKEISKLKEEIENIIYEMSGVKAINYQKIPMNANPELAHERLLELIEKKEQKEKEIERLSLNIKAVENTLSKMSANDKQMCIDLIAKKGNVYKVGYEYGYSKSGMWSRIKREIEHILRD